MNRTKLQIKRAFLKKEKSLEQIHYWIICAFAVCGYCYWSFLEADTIGRDSRYFWYVFLLPTATGMLILGFYRREFLLTRFMMNKGFILWTFMIVFYFLQGVMFSYLTFGQVARVSWDYLNYRTAMDHPVEVIVCDVKRFWSGKRRAKVEFSFNSQHEAFPVSRDFISAYKDTDPKMYQVKVEVREGIWNYYLVVDWNLEHR